MASMKRLRAISLTLLAREHQRRRQLRIGLLTGLGERHGLADLAQYTRVQRTERGRPGGDQPRPQPFERVLAAPFLDLRLLPVPAAAQHEALGLEMVLVAVGVRLDERRAPAAPAPQHCPT